jgi:hypothetical protein
MSSLVLMEMVGENGILVWDTDQGSPPPLDEMVRIPLDELIAQLPRNDPHGMPGVAQPMETAPRDGRWLLGFSRGVGDVPTVFPMRAEGDAWSDGEWRRHPHFWMPMPELPQVKA